MPATGKWETDGPWVVKKLDALDDRTRVIDDKLDATREDIAELKGASRVNGGLWGGIVAAVLSVAHEFIVNQ